MIPAVGMVLDWSEFTVIIFAVDDRYWWYVTSDYETIIDTRRIEDLEHLIGIRRITNIIE